jgi:hypothetical protein
MERWVKTLRAELLNRTLIWNQTHLGHELHQYQRHHDQHRTRLDGLYSPPTRRPSAALVPSPPRRQPRNCRAGASCQPTTGPCRGCTLIAVRAHRVHRVGVAGRQS